MRRFVLVPIVVMTLVLGLAPLPASAQEDPPEGPPPAEPDTEPESPTEPDPGSESGPEVAASEDGLAILQAGSDGELPADAGFARASVDSEAWEAVEESGEVPVMIRLEEQTDLERVGVQARRAGMQAGQEARAEHDAGALTDEPEARAAVRDAAHTARVTTVVEALQATAEDSQDEVEGLLADLERTDNAAEVRSYWVFNGFAATLTEEGLAVVADHPDVATVTVDTEHQLPEPQQADPPSLPEWSVESVNAPQVWEEHGMTGEDVVVGVMDSGVDGDHPALAGSYRGGDGDHDASWFVPTDEDYPTPGDGNGHGTHVTGSVTGGAPGRHVGVAPGAEWIAAKVFTDTGGTDDSTLQAGFQWMLAPDDDPAAAPHVVNNSWGNPDGMNETFREAVQAWEEAGIVPVFSNGNEGPGEGTVGSPASFPESIGVGATDIDDVIAGFSSRGPSNIDGEELTKPDISAPGAAVVSAWPEHLEPEGYRAIDGTSMAAPHVSGVIALMLSSNADAGVDEVRASIDRTARTEAHMGDDLPDNTYGHGIADAEGAVTDLRFSGTVTGTVTDTDDDPVEATVSVDDTDFTTTADPDTGDYQLVLPEGTHTVRASAYGFVETTETVEVEIGEAIEVDLTLDGAPEATLSGTVTDSDGDPVSGAQVTVEDTPVDPVYAGSDGEFELTVAEGTYTVRASSPGHRDHAQEVTVDGATEVTFDLPPLVQETEPGWTQFLDNDHRTGFADGVLGPEGLRQEWQTALGGEAVFSGAVIADGQVLAVVGDTLHAVDADDGEPVWSTVIGEESSSVPTVVDGTAYVGGGDTGELHAVDTDDGSLEWTTNLSPDRLTYTTPVVEDGAVYVTTGFGAGNGGNVVALDAEDGEELWHTHIGGQIFFGPLLADGTLYAASNDDQRLVALDPEDGEEQWDYTRDDDRTFLAMPTFADGTVYAAVSDSDAGQGSVLAIDADNGELLWEADDNGDAQGSAPIIYDDLLIIGSHARGAVSAYDRSDGSVQWRTTPGGATSTSMLTTGDGNVVVGTQDMGGLYVLDAETGEVGWQDPDSAQVVNTPAMADGQLVALDRNGRLTAYVPTGTVEGVVEDSDGPVAGAAVSVSGTDDATETDDDGFYSVDTEPGEVTVEVSAYGLADDQATVEVFAGRPVTQSFELEPVGEGSLQVTVVDEDSTPLSDAQVALPDTPLDSGTTDDDGEFTWDEVAEGTHQLTVELAGYAPAETEVAVTAGETAQAELTLAPYDVAVVGDQEFEDSDMLTRRLDDAGYLVDSVEFDDLVDTPGSYRAIVMNSFEEEVDAETLETFVDAAAAAGTSLLWMNTWGSSSGTLKERAELLGDPDPDGFADGNLDGRVQATILDEHPITDGFQIDEDVDVLSDGSRWSAFDGWSGRILASLRTDGTGESGDAIGILASGYDSVEIALSPFAASALTRPDQVWLDGAEQLYLAAVGHAIDVEFGQVTGVVTDANGEPIEATVTDTGSGEETSADAEGAFELWLPPGVTELHITAAGFQPETQEVTVAAGEPTDLGEVELADAGEGTVTGTVTDAASGDAIAGAEVMLEGDASAEAVTDDDGGYEVDVPGGAYEVTFTADDYESVTESDVDVSDEETVTMDAELDAQPVVGVLGDLDPDDDGVGMYTTVLRDHEVAATPMAWDDDVTDFEAVALVRPDDPGEDDFVDWLAAADDAAVSTVFLESGFTSWTGGASVQLLRAHLDDPSDHGRVGTGVGATALQTNAEDHPLFDGLDDRVEVLAPSERPGYFEGYSGDDIADLVDPDDEVIASGAAYQPRPEGNIQLLLSSLGPTLSTSTNPESGWTDDGAVLFANALRWAADPELGELEGTVTDTDGEPVADATVTVDPSGTQATTDSDGEYGLALPAGEVTVTAEAFGYEPTSESAEIESGETTTIDLELERAGVGSISGTVMVAGPDDDPEPAEDVVVDLMGSPLSTETDADGEFTFTNVEPGEYELDLTSDDILREQIPIEVEPDGDHQVDVDARAVATVGVFADYQGNLVDYLQWWGYQAEELDWDDTDAIADVDLVVGNRATAGAPDPGLDGWRTVTDIIDRSGVSGVWLGQSNRGTVGLYAEYEGTPEAEGEATNAGQPTATVTDPDHPITDGLQGAFDLTGEDSRHSWFTDFDGDVVANVESDEVDGEPLAGFRGRTADNVDVLLGTAAFSSYGWHDPDDPGANHYTSGHNQLLRNGLRWALDASELGADVSGDVLVDGEASGGGHVEVEGTGLSYPIADDGSYLVPLQPGTWTLRAEQPGHASGEIEVTVGAGDSLDEDIDLGEATVADVSGQVTDMDGDPLAEADVALEAVDEPVTTDGDGQWSFEDVPHGAWLLEISAEGHTTNTQRIDVDEDEMTVDVALRPTPDVALAGETTDNLEEWLTDRGWNVEPFARNDLEPITDNIAEYDLVIQNGVGTRPDEDAFGDLQSAAADEGVSMIMAGQFGGGAILDLSDHTGDPGDTNWSFTDDAIAMTPTQEHPLVAGLDVDEATEVIEDPGSNQQYLYYEDWSGETVATVGGTVPPEGADEPETFGEAIGFRFSSAGSVEVLLASLGSSSSYGGPDNGWLPDAELLYANALEFAMDATQGTVAGAVEDDDGAAIAGAEVVALGQDESTTTNDDGGYELALAAGEETLEASADGYEPEEQTVTVAAGETITADFTLDSVPRGDLEVGVTSGGDPVAGAQVAAVGPVEEDAETNDEGVALFDALPADEYEVTVTFAGHLEEVLTVEVEADTTTTLPVELTPHDVAVLVDADGAMVELLRDAGVAATEITWDDTEDLSAFEVVIVNGGDPDDEAVTDLLEHTDDLGTGLVVTGSWGPNAGGLALLERVMDDLVVGDTGYDDGPVDLVNVDPDHPVVEGLDDDTELLAESSPYSVLDETPGSVLADVQVGGEDEPVAAGSSVAVDERDAGNAHVLLSAGAATDYVGPGYGWTDATEQLLLNAVDFARPDQELESVEVRPDEAELEPDGTEQFAAWAIFDDESETEVTDEAEWVSEDTGVVTVDDAGLATAVAEGDADVTATYEEFTGTAEVVVEEEDEPDPPEVVGVEVTPDPLTVEVDGTGELTATATFDDGSTEDVTDEAEWVSDDEGIATVDAGVVTGVAVGDTDVTASFGGEDDAAEVVVEEDEPDPPPEDPVDLVVMPDETTIGIGGVEQFEATAIYDDDETVDVTEDAEWTSGDEETAAVDDAGEVTGVSEGAVEVTATVEGLSDSATVTVEPGPVGLERIAADPGRVEVAIAASQHRFDDAEAGAVVLARADAYPDALAGTTLAADHDAPLLLTSSDELLGNVSDEIARVLGDDGAVYLTGGTVALDDTVEGAVDELGYEVVRLGGETRFETAGLIAEELGERSQVLVTTGLDFPDALTAGAAAAANDGVVLLSADDDAHDVVDEYLAGFDGEVTAVGGPATRAYPDAEAVMGETRDETAVAVAEAFFDEPAAFGVARRDGYPDALSGGAHIAAYQGPLLLSYTEDVPEETAEWLVDTDATGGFVYGGTAAINDDTFNQIEDLVGGSAAP